MLGHESCIDQRVPSFNIFVIVLIVKIFLASGRLIGGFSAFKI